MGVQACAACGSRVVDWDDAAQEWRCMNGHRVAAPSPRQVEAERRAERRRRLEQKRAAREAFAAERAVFDARRASS